MSVRIWAIGDTHLSFAKSKDMGRFGALWVNHTERLATAWRERVAPDDVVLLAGDVSWAQSTKKVLPDLAWLCNLPGRKILIRGNHDHWWKDLRTARSIAEPLGFVALEGDSVAVDGVIVCGVMGHVAPNDPYYAPDPKKDRYTRELGRLTDALDDAMARRANSEPILLMMHYPPFTSEGEPTAYVEAIMAKRPAVCVYGHLHHDHEWTKACNGEHEGVRFVLAAADFLNMAPIQIWPPVTP